MKPLILTMGEPAGIGSEITARAWRLLRLSGPCFALIDDAERDFGVPIARIS
jgi:4-hydroxythreonine-4-phosphate dehydrogenase